MPNVLLVDDDDALRARCQHILEGGDIDVRCRHAASAAAADAVVRAGEADVVLLSSAPPIDGRTLLGLWRQAHDSVALPVLLVVTPAELDGRPPGADAASDYLLRPFSAPELLSRVQVQLRLRLLRDELKRVSEREARLGTHDVLTGLANRRHLVDQARREMARCRRHTLVMSLCALDVDHFRGVNERLGPLGGDATIAELAHLASRALRQPDILGHAGGGRFLALLPQTDVAEAALVGERLRVAVQGHPFVGLGHDHLAVSVGCVSFPAARLESVEELINAAEACMDRAKAAGGNRLVSFEPPAGASR